MTGRLEDIMGRVEKEQSPRGYITRYTIIEQE
jgi:hypothetical protein